MNGSIVSLIDHALLHPTLTDAEIKAGCLVARQLGVAAVCVKPAAVLLAADCLRGSAVRVATVIGFPHGGNLPEIKTLETRLACEQGAREVDMVVNIGKVLGRDWAYVEREIRGVVDMAHSGGATTKVIFETDYVVEDEFKLRLCEICVRAGAEYVKTSTGFGYVRQADGSLASRGATEADVRLMKQHAGPHLQVKASGGIRDYESAKRMVEAGATRLGTTATAAIAAGESAATVACSS